VNRPDSILNDVPPVTLFGRIDRASWGWLHLEGRERCPFLAGYLPSLPRESFHPSIATSSGRAALEAGFQTYKIIKQAPRNARMVRVACLMRDLWSNISFHILIVNQRA